jgi:iron complex outermembrane receptor protein
MKGAKIAALFVALCLSHAAWAQERQFDLTSMDAVHGIPEFARQAGIQIVAPADDLGGIKTPAIHGNLDVRVALRKLLVGTDLEIASDDGAVITLRRRAKATKQSGSLDSSTAQSRTAEGAGGPGVGDSSELANSRSLQEIVVTAQKKEERLQDVPVPVTVLDAQTLANNGENRLQDYFATVPGLNLNSFGNGNTNISIRGLSTGAATTPTVGVIIDDVPFGSTSGLANGSLLYPDVDPGDLARIEVLRGPQGTLYGADSIGGLINFVTVDPSPSDLSGRVQVLGDDVEHGAFGGGVRGSINVPLSQSIAVRASAFAREDPGYIDNIETGERNINRANVTGGRLSALWQLSDTASLKLGAMLQNTDGHGSGIGVFGNTLPAPIVLGTLQQTAMRGTLGYSNKLGVYTAKLKVKLGNLDFTSISGYGTYSHSDTGDVSSGFLAGFAQSTLGLPAGVSGVSGGNSPESRKFSQEFRLSSASDQRIEWLAGAFYTHEYSPFLQNYVATNPLTGSPVAQIGNFNFPTTLSEYALFGDLTVHFTGQFDIQVGARESWNRQVYNETDSGPYVAVYEAPYSSPLVYPTERTSANSFTYLVTPRFKISPDLMVYARLATGYRLGGPNYSAFLGNLPLRFNPDTTTNYELGAKGDFVDHILTVDASAYYIDWKDIQLNLVNPVTQFTYFGNGGTAKSQGLELSVETRPARGLTIAANASLNDAELTQNLPVSAAAIGSAGDRLPYSSRFSGNLSLNQDIGLANESTLFFGGSIAYVGAREGEFVSTSAPSGTLRFSLPAYAQVNLSAGARRNSWTANLFVNNVGDKRGVLQETAPWGAVGGGSSVIYIQPRTVGASIAKRF